MANGETLHEIRDILAENRVVDIPQEVVNRLTLSILAETHEKLLCLEVRQNKLEEKAIIPWVEKNKPISFLLAALSFIVVVFVPDVVKPWIAKALGLP